MRHRPLGGSGMKGSELCLGTWGLSGDGYGPVSDAEQDKVIERARALGITLFDTADCYAHGEMEKRLGRMIPDDARARIVTKIGTDMDASPPRKRFDERFLRDSFERSAERLQRETLDAVLLHNPSELALETDASCGVLEELYQAKRVRAWGVSAGSVGVARAAIQRGAKLIEIPFNVFHRDDLKAVTAEAREKNVGVLARSVLAYGLLAGHWPADKQFAPEDHRAERWTPDDLRRRARQLDALRPAVGGDVLTLRAAALRYVLAQDVVSCAVIGPRNTIQLDQLVREAGRGPPYLAPEKTTALEARLTQAGT